MPIEFWSKTDELNARLNGGDFAGTAVFLAGSDGHTAWGNRELLRRAGIAAPPYPISRSFSLSAPVKALPRAGLEGSQTVENWSFGWYFAHRHENCHLPEHSSRVSLATLKRPQSVSCAGTSTLYHY